MKTAEYKKALADAEYFITCEDQYADIIIDGKIKQGAKLLVSFAEQYCEEEMLKSGTKELTLYNYWDASSSEERQNIVERAFRLIDIQKEYIKLLVEELDEVVPLAYNHGWRSKRADIGKRTRSKIERLINHESTKDTKEKRCN